MRTPYLYTVLWCDLHLEYAIQANCLYLKKDCNRLSLTVASVAEQRKFQNGLDCLIYSKILLFILFCLQNQLTDNYSRHMQNTIYKRTENRRNQILVLTVIASGNKALINKLLSFKSLNEPCFLFFHHLLRVREDTLSVHLNHSFLLEKTYNFFPQMWRTTTPSFSRFETFSQIICFFLDSKEGERYCYSTCVGLLSVNFDIVIVTSKTTHNVTEGKLKK